MMSPDDLMSNPPADESNKKTTCRPAAELAPRCPRCDSPNTKFCYYNNYSLSQPRYFCKTCRRYWTKGGALRNIPIGGGCRKNKKMINSKSSSRFSNDSMDSAGGSSSYLDHIGGFKFSNISLSSGMNFHSLDTNLPRTFSPIQHYQQLSTNPSFGNISRTLSSASCFGLDNQSGNSSGGTFMGFNFPLSSSELKQDHHANAQVLEDHDIKTNDVVASSIESLSSINQDLHWKLQQQRLGMMMFGEENNITNHHKEVTNTSLILPPPTMNIIPQKPQPILFENLEISPRVKDHDVHQAVGSSGSGSATEWLLDHNSNRSLVNTTQTNSSNTGINQAWGNFYQYTSLP